MSWIVRESIQDYEVVLATTEDEICLVIILPGFLAQDAAAFCLFFYVFYSPRCPKIFHQTYIICRLRVKCNEILLWSCELNWQDTIRISPIGVKLQRAMRLIFLISWFFPMSWPQPTRTFRVFLELMARFFVPHFVSARQQEQAPGCPIISFPTVSFSLTIHSRYMLGCF